MTDQAKVNALEAQLGFNLMAGGRHFGEMKLTPMASGKVFMEMPGSLVTVEQALTISAVLKNDDPNCCTGCFVTSGATHADLCPVYTMRLRNDGDGENKPKRRKR